MWGFFFDLLKGPKARESIPDSYRGMPILLQPLQSKQKRKNPHSNVGIFFDPDLREILSHSESKKLLKTTQQCLKKNKASCISTEGFVVKRG